MKKSIKILQITDYLNRIIFIHKLKKYYIIKFLISSIVKLNTCNICAEDETLTLHM